MEGEALLLQCGEIVIGTGRNDNQVDSPKLNSILELIGRTA
jgi:hypothetical protein